MPPFFQTLVRSTAGAVLAATVIFSGACQASAQQSQTLTITQFLAHPNELLQQFPDGGAQMTSLVQQFTIDDASTTPVILGLLGAANARQKGAIGEGFAQAAKIIVLTDQARAADLQSRIAAINDPVVNVAFANGLGDVKLGAVGGGPLGAVGGGLGGQTNPLGNNAGGAGPVEPIEGHGVNTPIFSITSSVSGTGGTTITTLSGPVSATTLP